MGERGIAGTAPGKPNEFAFGKLGIAQTKPFGRKEECEGETQHCQGLALAS